MPRFVKITHQHEEENRRKVGFINLDRVVELQEETQSGGTHIYFDADMSALASRGRGGILVQEPLSHFIGGQAPATKKKHDPDTPPTPTGGLGESGEGSGTGASQPPTE
jgi:hypothetical protein